MMLFWRFLLGSLLLAVIQAQSAQAQITPDATLPNRSRVDRSGRTQIITGGTQTGRNLFHSFREFSIPTGEAASFQQIAPDVENVISRVTGSSVSNIDGLIEALGSDGAVSPANFFLLNPNGILFGENASLNIGGSFLATTADRLRFSDGAGFRADGTQTNPLLTLSVPVGLQFSRAAERGVGRIVNRSDFEADHPLFDSAGSPLLDPDTDGNRSVGLRVLPGRSLALLGQNITFLGGYATAPGGRIELGAVQQGTVNLMLSGMGWIVFYPSVQQLGNIQIRATQAGLTSTIRTNGEGGGSIQMRGDRISITDFSIVNAYTLGDVNGGEIRVTGNRLLLDDALITSNTYGAGSGSNIAVDVNELVLRSGGQISNSTHSTGQGGNLSIRASRIELSDIAREPDGSPFLEGEFPFSSGLFARVQEGAAGNGGNITLSVQQLTLTDGAQIGAETFGSGQSGEIRISARTIELDGVAQNADGTAIPVRGVAAPSTLSSFSFPAGQAGQIILDTDRLSLSNGATLQSSTQGSGNAADMIIRASTVELSGTAPGTNIPTGFFTFSGGIPATQFGASFGNPTATGRGADIRITTDRLTVSNGAILAVGSLNPNLDDRGRSGTLRVDARVVQLDDRAGLFANTASGRGGDLDLQIQDVLLLRNRSEISTTAGCAERGGNGGDIQLNSEFIVSSLTQNSDITANAFTGNGGNVTIASQGILGIAPQASLSPGSDITASSEFGLSGNISINAVNVDPTRGLVQLPIDLIDASQLIAQTCAPSRTATEPLSEFIITGRGGLPPGPADLSSSESVLTDWATLPPELMAAIDSANYPGNPQGSETQTAIAPQAETLNPPEIIEAQELIRDDRGNLQLVAQGTAAAPQRMLLAVPNCNAG